MISELLTVGGQSRVLTSDLKNPRWGKTATTPDFGQFMPIFFQNLKFDKTAIKTLPVKIPAHLDHFLVRNDRFIHYAHIWHLRLNCIKNEVAVLPHLGNFF